VLERAVPFTELFNFRDLGGYATTDGRTIAWRRLYRSDDLCRLRDGEHDRFTALGIRTVIDLRRPAEVAELGRIADLAGVAYHHLHLVHPPWAPYTPVDNAERAAYLIARYGEMAAAGGDAIGAALRMIADEASAPLVLHCIAGKDRTGIVSALTLALLGVDDETIATDYALSELSEVSYRARHGKEPLAVAIAPAPAILGFLDALRAEHGSIESYAKSIGVSADHIAAMQAHLLTA
jgi:hypothetical protein